MKINKRKIILLVFFILLIYSFIAKTRANTVDLSKSGSVTITLKEKKEVQDAEITIFKIANTKIEDNNLKYEYTEQISGFDIEVDKLNNIESVKNLIQYINKNNVQGITSYTDSNGQVNFNDLSTGLYLIVETKGVTGYYNINPFIVSIPNKENGEWIYNISSTPKVGAVKDPQEKPPVVDSNNKVNQDIDTDVSSNNNSPSNSGVSSNNNVIENVGEQLIKTGQNIWPMIVCLVIGVICIIVGITIILRRKNNEE